MKARQFWRQLWVAIITLSLSVYTFATPVQHATLRNGLQVYVLTDHRAPVVLSSIWYRVGGGDESNGRTGLSHLLEHLMFRGTHAMPNDGFSRRIEKTGGTLNAMTSRDFTMYYEYLPKKDLSVALKLEADRMRGLNISRQHFLQEQKVVHEERRMRTDNKPTALAYERLMALALNTSPYQHPVVGWPSDIEQLTKQDAQQWYDRWYRPNNAFVLIVGDVNAKQAIQKVKRAFRRIPSHALPKRKRLPEITPLGIKRALVRLPTKVPVAMMAYLAPSIATTQHAWQPYALTVLSAVLSIDDEAMLGHELINTRGIATSVSSEYDADAKHETLFSIFAFPSKGKSLTSVEQAIDSVIENVQTHLISHRRLERIKAQLLAASTYQKDSLSARAMTLGSALISGQSTQTSQNWAKHIKAVTRQQIREVARLYLTKKRLSVVYLEPTLKHQKS